MLQRIRCALFVTFCLCTFSALSIETMAQETETEEEKAKGKNKKGLPLEPTRRVQFETDEGTWLSLDVSADGKSILFELLGDLYEVAIEGGDATAVTEGMAYDSQPRYSPDGKWIAFISDRDGSDNVWIIRSDGTEPRKLSKEKRASFLSPTWTPDSQYVLASKGGRETEFWMFHAHSRTQNLEPRTYQRGVLLEYFLPPKVSCTCSSVSRLIFQISWTPVLSDSNTIHFPSRANQGCPSSPGVFVRLRGSDPSMRARKTSSCPVAFVCQASH